MSSDKALKSLTGKRAPMGMRIQPRDRQIVWTVGIHGLMIMPQLRLAVFEDYDQQGRWVTVSDQAVYRRLGKLCKAGLLEHQHTWYGDHGIYRATRAGLELSRLDVAPARLDKRDYEHDLLVVDLALKLTRHTCEGWIPERMIRSRLKPGTSIGRVPDGLYIGEGGERWAVELEVSGKESQRYYEACCKYAARHRQDLPEEAATWGIEEYVSDYVESDATIDGVIWYFYSTKKKHRARDEAGKIMESRKRQRQPTDHLRLLFDNAYHPQLPPIEKYQKQQERKREAEEQKRREREQHERRESQRHREREERTAQDLLYREAVAYLSQEEERQVYEAIIAEYGDL